MGSNLAFAGGAALSQAPEPKSAPPVLSAPASEAPQPQRPLSGAGRNQFIAPVMNIDIKAEGIALPAGVAQPEEALTPAATAPKPPATAK